MTFEQLEIRLGPQDQHVWRQHPNGLGWVYITAYAAPAAYVAGIVGEFGHVGPNASVHEAARVGGRARVLHSAQVGGNAHVFGHATIRGGARIYGYAKVFGFAQVFGAARVCGYAIVHGSAKILGTARVFGTAVVSDARILDREWVNTPRLVSRPAADSADKSTNLETDNEW